jgi:hypothetical protein
MLELCFVAPVFVFVWIGINYIKNDLLMQQQLMHESRTGAWAVATSGDKCNNIGGAIVGSAERAALFGEFGAKALAAFELLPGHGTILSDVGHVDTIIPGHSPDQKDGVFNRFNKQHQMAGRTFLLCNDSLPALRNTVLPWMLPIGIKELGVSP